MVLGRLGRTENSPSKSDCSILPLARHFRAGELFSASTPARTSLLKPAAGQKVQSPNDRQGAYHRQRCEYSEEHSEHALPSLACCRVQQRIVTHGRRPCNNVVAILAKDKTPRCALGVLRQPYVAPAFPLPCLAGGTRPGEEVRDGPHNHNRCGSNRCGVAPTAASLRPRAAAL